MLTTDDAIDRARSLRVRFAATAAEVDRTAAFPHENFAALREAGLLALSVRREWGGDALGFAAACRVVDEIAQGEASTALVLGMQYIHQGAPAMNGTWRHDGHERISRDAAEHGALLNVMRVEPELGTPARGGLPTTTAARTTGGWRLSGHKLYSTGSPILEYFVTWARTAGDDPQVGWFAVKRGTPGIRIVETWDHLGMRATGSHDLILEDVFVLDELALDLRPPAAWMPPDPATGTWNNLVLAALYCGIPKAAKAWLASYLHERKPSNLGASLATLPRMQSVMGEIEALLWTNDRLIYGLAEEADRDGCSPRLAGQTSFAKYVATNNAVKAMDLAMSLIGNPGLTRANPLERHHRDVLCSRIHVPQDDMVTLMAGKAVLGIT